MESNFYTYKREAHPSKKSFAAEKTEGSYVAGFLVRIKELVNSSR